MPRLVFAPALAGSVVAAWLCGCSIPVDGRGAALDAGRTPGRDASTARDDASQPPLDDASTTSREASDDPDAGDSPDGPTTILPPDPCGSTTGSCTVPLPTGWTLVAFAATQAAGCPAGFDGGTRDVVEGPSASGTCACGACSVTTAPSCASGAVGSTYDMKNSSLAGSCLIPSTPSSLLANNPAGACGTDLYQGVFASFDVKYTAPAASGGSCSAPGIAANGGSVTYASQDRVCAADSNVSSTCKGSTCTPTVEPGYQACIMMPGVQPCPTGATFTRHVVGAGASAACADCACTVDANCSGTVTLYADATCSKKSIASVPTGQCTAMTSFQTVKAYQYAGDAPTGVSCTASAASGPKLTWTQEETVCCGG